jgi:hypothetical protein
MAIMWYSGIRTAQPKSAGIGETLPGRCSMTTVMTSQTNLQMSASAAPPATASLVRAPDFPHSDRWCFAR